MLKKFLYAACALGIIFSLIVIVKNGNFIQLGSFSEDVAYGLPVRLKIPKIKVDAVVEPVGLTSDGAVGVPKGPDLVAWFDLGPRPGEKGSSVFSGHYGWKNNIPAVFDSLDKLVPGDKIYVEDERGVTTTFVVRGSRTYAENDAAVDVFASGDGLAHLNLITCQGDWNKASKSYAKRLVVFTDKEEEGFVSDFVMTATPVMSWFGR